ncbi:hypothetical protein ACTTAK_06650 [Rhodobacter capsulatus]|uniref:hypothetical protein n=1 Tax=Rhodobacter capsulatus TaxID=1061 RepID=UPI0011448345|nr:hypothetical protein [Rhodobacter capsulatus]TQD37440.1 hypothetical protein FKW81_02345 [Rhodobacter capsulatus]
MVGIVAAPVAMSAYDVADLVARHLRLISAAEAAAKPETKDIGLQLQLAAGAARTRRRAQGEK